MRRDSLKRLRCETINNNGNISDGERKEKFKMGYCKETYLIP